MISWSTFSTCSNEAELARWKRAPRHEITAAARPVGGAITTDAVESFDSMHVQSQCYFICCVRGRYASHSRSDLTYSSPGVDQDDQQSVTT